MALLRASSCNARYMLVVFLPLDKPNTKSAPYLNGSHAAWLFFQDTHMDMSKGNVQMIYVYDLVALRIQGADAVGARSSHFGLSLDLKANSIFPNTRLNGG